MVIMELAELEKEDNRVGLVFKYKVVRNGLMVKETFEHRPRGSKGEPCGYLGDKHSGQTE